MSIDYFCYCGAAQSAERDQSGQLTECKSCGAKLVVPKRSRTEIEEDTVEAVTANPQQGDAPYLAKYITDWHKFYRSSPENCSTRGVLSTQLYALAKIVDRNSTPLIPLLLEIVSVKHYSSYDHGAAKDVLAGIGPPALDATIAALREPEFASKASAVGLFSAFGKQAVPQLGSLLKDLGLREAALQALVHVGKDATAAMPQLRQMMLDRSLPMYCREKAAEFFSKVGPVPKALVSDFVKILNESSDDPPAYVLKLNAAKALGNTGDAAKSAASSLLSFLESKWGSQSVEDIAEAIVRSGNTDQLVAFLMSRLERKGDSPFWALSCLEKCGPSILPALPRLRQIVRDSHARYIDRVKAAAALGALGSTAKSASRDLTALYSEKVPDGEWAGWRGGVFEALERIDPDAARRIALSPEASNSTKQGQGCLILLALILSSLGCIRLLLASIR